MAKHGVAPVEDEAPSVLRKILKWGNYESFGSPVRGTRFIPMKSPLTSALQESLAQQVLRGSQSTPPPQHAATMATPCRNQPPTPPSVGSSLGGGTPISSAAALRDVRGKTWTDSET